MSGSAEIHGEVAPGYEAVAEAVAQLFADGRESGASAAAFHDGRMVVDLWGGSVGRDSLVHVYSVSKPFAAACALWLVDRGVLALETRVAELWPEYAQGGKQDTTLRHLLSHQAGLLAWRAPQPRQPTKPASRCSPIPTAYGLPHS